MIKKALRASVEIPQQAVKSRSLQVAAVLHVNVLQQTMMFSRGFWRNVLSAWSGLFVPIGGALRAAAFSLPFPSAFSDMNAGNARPSALSLIILEFGVANHVFQNPAYAGSGRNALGLHDQWPV